jgi:UDP-galactopyranose mutase
MLEGIDVLLNKDYFVDKENLDNLAKKVVFTGMIDEYFNYKYGRLEYRSLVFKNEILNLENYQGNAVVNYTDSKTPYTRIIEHKHFEFGTQPTTVITKEYPTEWTFGDEPYYPINNAKNSMLYQKYKALSKQKENVIFKGRLAEYKYFDMHHIIFHALETAREEFDK